MTSDVAYN